MGSACPTSLTCVTQVNLKHSRRLNGITGCCLMAVTPPLRACVNGRLVNGRSQRRRPLSMAIGRLLATLRRRNQLRERFVGRTPTVSYVSSAVRVDGRVRYNLVNFARSSGNACR